MSQPPAFQRGTRFASYAALFPAAPFNSGGADTEFDNVKATLAVILTTLLAIQRDDTKLANGSVHADALDATVLTLFSAAGVTGEPKGAWVTATAYAVWDIVTESNQAYLCVEDHTSGTFATDLAADKWVAIQSAAENVNLTAISGLAATNAQAAFAEIYGLVPTFARKHALGEVSL